MKSYLQSIGYVFNQDQGLWRRPDYEGIAYSDGDEIEKRLREIVANASDVSVMSIELANHSTDWPSLYHLSRKRGNLLRPFEEQLQGKSVLEIGAGCGAITRYLGEIGAEVLALEGSPRRASIAASRCRGLKNVTILAEAFHLFKPIPQFDVVTLIGVLEYARKFFPGKGADPVDAMLATAKQFLQPGGKLIIAIENQLGLKYFAGFPEDHVGTPMFGIEEHYIQDSVVTFGRRELGARVGKAGLTAQQWWYPFPDYKLPSLMVSEAGALPQDDLDLTPLIRGACISDPQYPAGISFNLERAWRPVVRNGLLGEMANSFLLVASDTDDVAQKDPPLAIHYATDRRPEFAKKLVFEPLGKKGILTRQKALYPEAMPDPDSPLTQRLADQGFIKGELWQDRLVQIMSAPDWRVEQIQEWFEVWFDAFCDFVEIDRTQDITNLTVSGNYFDAIPRNMFIDENGKPKFIDQEWEFSKDIKVGFIIFRAFFGSISSVSAVENQEYVSPINALKLFYKVTNFDSSSFSENIIKDFIKLDREIKYLADGLKIATLSNMEHWVIGERNNFSVTLKKLTQPDGQINTFNQALDWWNGKIKALDKALAERDEQINILNRELDGRNGQIKALNQALSEREREINQLLRSKSWRFTKPLRFFHTNLVTRPLSAARCISSASIRRIWCQIPLSMENKQKLKSILFKGLPFLFKWSHAYRNWQSSNKLFSDGTGLLSVSIQDAGGDYIPLLKGKPLKDKPAKLVCFYLPQFHPIAENNTWWGEGFTEWTNVQPAQPQFVGHYQPHVPDELGYYNLLDPSVQRRQVELAKLYGIEGFCFYFYWFGGKRLLERPIENYFKNNSLQLSFCLCWANENWSRRWDGLDSEVLIAQQHSPEDDLAFIQHVAEYMRDARYIRIDGKPLLLVYRPSLLPSAKETAKRWRDWCRNEGIGEIFLAYTQSFEAVDPRKYGFDAAVEFPPNNSAPPNITHSVTPIRDEFGCTVYDWHVFVERSEKYQPPGYKIFRSVCPSWDNTARRKSRGTIFCNNTPALYQRWLENAIRDTEKNMSKPDERLIFVNAWNEWAEGAHLEPDQRYGYAWLQATRDALLQASAISTRKIVLVSHDAHPHGAQYLALNLARTLSSEFGFKVDLVLLGNGILASEFARWASVHNLSGRDPRGTEAVFLARKLAAAGHKAALVNTTVSGLFLETLADAGLHCVALIHELRKVIDSNALHAHALAIAKRAGAVVFPAQQVADSFPEIAKIPIERLNIRHQGLYKRNAFRGDNENARSILRKELGLNESDRIVLGVGYGDHRKGVDLFVEAGLQVIKAHPDTYFVWVGHWESRMRALIEQRLTDAGLTDHFLFVGRKDDTDIYYAAADLYALTSREDPFPSVVMESLAVSVPVIGFKGAGGFDTLLEKGCGILVPEEDPSCFADALLELLDNPIKTRALGNYGATLIQESFSFRHYVFDLLDMAELPVKRISAIVPNYNYARYLEKRLNSILSQSYPIFEIIVLDDASTDNSIEVIESCLSNTSISHRLLRNNQNSGSVFQQWRRAVECSRGDFIWICEADDFAESAFLERVMSLFDDAQVVMGYTQSYQIDESGNILCDSYLDYTNDICPQRWRQDYVCEGREELSRVLAIKNSIPNVSAVIFRRSSLQKALDHCHRDLLNLRIAGDWLIYSEVLLHGKIGFIAESLNFHRRHQSSVTISSPNTSHLAEIIFMQKHISERVLVDENVRVKATDYTKKIYAQFLNTNGNLDPSENPEVKKRLKFISDNSRHPDSSSDTVET